VRRVELRLDLAGALCGELEVVALVDLGKAELRLLRRHLLARLERLLSERDAGLDVIPGAVLAALADDGLDLVRHLLGDGLGGARGVVDDQILAQKLVLATLVRLWLTVIHNQTTEKTIPYDVRKTHEIKLE